MNIYGHSWDGLTHLPINDFFTRQTYKLNFFFIFLTIVHFAGKKNMLISKHSITFVISYNLKKSELGYIFAKYNNLKFSISLKSYE